MTKKSTATISLALTYDAWRDLEGALFMRAVAVKEHEAQRERLNGIRQAIEAQVREQHPRWRP
jgi:7,8-dihydro-6-hydroxymethylpterin-pyrophosphokinase